MRAAADVKAYVARKGGLGLRFIALSPQIDLFIFDGSPKTLDDDIVPPRAFSVHADLDLPVGQHFDKLRRSELATLIRVEDFGGPMPGQRFSDYLDAKVSLQRDRHSPCKDTAGEPVHNRRKTYNAPRHWNLGEVHRPDLVGPNDRQVAQKIGVDFVPGVRFRGVGHPMQCPDAPRL